MASHYRDLIITGLEEFDRVSGNADRGDTFYEPLSWAGLSSTRAWESLSDTQKTSYMKIIQDQAKAGGCN